MQTLTRGWQDIGRPVAGVVLTIWAGQRLDLALAITVQVLLLPLVPCCVRQGQCFFVHMHGRTLLGCNSCMGHEKLR